MSLPAVSLSNRSNRPTPAVPVGAHLVPARNRTLHLPIDVAHVTWASCPCPRARHKLTGKMPVPRRASRCYRQSGRCARNRTPHWGNPCLPSRRARGMGIRASGKGHTSLQPATPISVCPRPDTTIAESGGLCTQENVTPPAALRSSGGHTAGARPPIRAEAFRSREREWVDQPRPVVAPVAVLYERRLRFIQRGSATPPHNVRHRLSPRSRITPKDADLWRLLPSALLRVMADIAPLRLRRARARGCRASGVAPFST